MDAHVDPALELSVEALARACKGDVSKLPSLVVHDNDAWPWANRVRPDKLNRLHMRRATFLRCVAGRLPIREGLWIRPDAQQFFFDLKPHHLGGGADTSADDVKGSSAARVMAKADDAGRLPDEEDYGSETLAKSDRRKVDAGDIREVATRDGKRSIRSSVFVGLRDTEL